MVIADERVVVADVEVIVGDEEVIIAWLFIMRYMQKFACMEKWACKLAPIGLACTCKIPMLAPYGLASPRSWKFACMVLT